MRVHRLVAITGCSGGGKSTLLDELRRRGHAVVEEPGRRIIAEERESGGHALPWIDLAAFARRALATARVDRRRAADLASDVFFDRGMIDAAAALEHATGRPALTEIANERYHRRVFVAPPWREIFSEDADRRHGFDEAVAEYERLLRFCDRLGYEVETLPKIGVAERANWMLRRLAAD